MNSHFHSRAYSRITGSAEEWSCDIQPRFWWGAFCSKFLIEVAAAPSCSNSSDCQQNQTLSTLLYLFGPSRWDFTMLPAPRLLLFSYRSHWGWNNRCWNLTFGNTCSNFPNNIRPTHITYQSQLRIYRTFGKLWRCWWSAGTGWGRMISYRPAHLSTITFRDLSS